jgi:hypothetical protein
MAWQRVAFAELVLHENDWHYLSFVHMNKNK